MGTFNDIFQKYTAVVFFDVETTGFSPDNDRIIELAALKIEQTEEGTFKNSGQIDLFVKLPEEQKIPTEIKKLTRISDLLYAVGEFNHGDIYRQLPPLIARAVESIGYSALYEMYRGGHIRGGKPGMDRVAFIQQYTPMYEREKQQAMTPEWVTAAIEKKAKTLPDNGRHLLKEREQDRKKHKEMYCFTRNNAFSLEGAKNTLALETGKGDIA